MCHIYRCRDVFLFACMLVIGIFASLIEIVAFRLGGKNIILCALLAQVIVFRLSSFGYVPGQSYLLLGTIIVNILMIYLADKFLILWFKRKGILNFWQDTLNYICLSSFKKKFMSSQVTGLLLAYNIFLLLWFYLIRIKK